MIQAKIYHNKKHGYSVVRHISTDAFVMLSFSTCKTVDAFARDTVAPGVRELGHN